MRTLILAVVSLLLLGACATKVPPAVAGAPLEPVAIGSLAKAHRAQQIYLAGQPSAEDLAAAKQLGIRTVLNLRKPSETPEVVEAKLVSDLGMHYVNVPWQGASELTDEVFDRARAAIAGAERPLLVHCASANRVGAVWIPYRVLDEGVELEVAVAEAKSIGLKTAEFESKARAYIARKR
jgi:uncharacterized protein (TIGR01244 family)